MRKVVFLLLIALCFGAKMPNVEAQTARTPVSHGNLIYEGSQGNAELYAADIHLLDEKISTIPERCFDPVCYAHIHNWEYRRINEETHTRHCADCGEENDLIGPHRADSWERDTIFYGGKTYPGKRYVCACGYQWSMEMTHTLIYEAVDEVNHRGRCALDGTSYCQGCEPIVEEHYAWRYEMDEEELQHVKICVDCGYQISEDCCFDETQTDESRRVCVCGRSVKQEEGSETPETPETEEAPETPDDPGTEEAPETSDDPGAEEAPETPDDPGTEEAPETPDDPGTEEAPETPDDPGTEEAPETPDDPGTEEAPETPDDPGTEEAPETPNDPGTGEPPGMADARKADAIRVA